MGYKKSEEKEVTQYEIKNECRTCGQKKMYVFTQGYCIYCLPDELLLVNTKYIHFVETLAQFGPINTKERLIDFYKILGLVDEFSHLYVGSGKAGMNIVEVGDCKARMDKENEKKLSPSFPKVSLDFH